MIADKECRQIAYRLHEEAENWHDFAKDDTLFDMCDATFVESMLSAFQLNDMDMHVYKAFDKLADFIDWPTCRIGYVPSSADRSCSACGVTFSTGTYQGGDHEEHEFMFCPHCGAEVVSND